MMNVQVNQDQVVESRQSSSKQEAGSNTNAIVQNTSISCRERPELSQEYFENQRENLIFYSPRVFAWGVGSLFAVKTASYATLGPDKDFAKLAILPVLVTAFCLAKSVTAFLSLYRRK